MNTIAERLKHARDTKDWSQGKLAVAAGLTPAAISNIEKGIRQSKGSLPQIAEALGVSHKWLAYGEGEMMDNSNPPSKAANDPPTYTPFADSLAYLFDKLPEDDPVLRSDVYARASDVIRAALGQLPSDQPTPALPSSSGTPSAAPQQKTARHT